MLENASYLAAAFTGIATIVAAWLTLRGGWRAAQITATANNLDSQLKGWRSYCDTLRNDMDELRKENTDIRKDLRAAEERADNSDRLQAQCELKLRMANQNIKTLEARLTRLENGNGEHR